MITLYTHTQQILFSGLGVILASILIGWLGVYIVHRGVLTGRQTFMYSGWVVAGIGCLVYILGWWIILSNHLVPHNVFERRHILFLNIFGVIGIIYAAREYEKKHDYPKIVVNTSYVLAFLVGFIPLIMFFIY